jgi:hypothetical protein
VRPEGDFEGLKKGGIDKIRIQTASYRVQIGSKARCRCRKTGAGMA